MLFDRLRKLGLNHLLSRGKQCDFFGHSFYLKIRFLK
jgi:hypothetical protein